MTKINELKMGQGFKDLIVYIVQRPEPIIRNGLKICNMIVKENMTDETPQARLSLFDSQIDKFPCKTGDKILVDGFAKKSFLDGFVADMTLGNFGSLKIINK